MAYVEWSDDFDVSNKTLNDQHKMLFDYINDYDQAFADEAGLGTMSEIFDKIVSYAAMHFEQEEAYMESVGYPGIKSHKHIHEQLVARVLEYKKQLAGGDRLVMKEIRLFLKNWLTGHIKGIDTKYAQHAAHNDAA